MKRHTGVIAAITLIVIGVIGLATTLLVSTVVLGHMGFGGSAGPVDVGPDDAGGRPSRVDAMFIERMVPHHQDAIDMAELALTESNRPEIKALAEDIKRSQTRENEQMRGWYSDWFGQEVGEGRGGGMMGPMMGGEVDLDRLREAEDFDRLFIEQMIPHHEMAVMMAQMAGSRSSRPEMRELTRGIIDDQTRQIEQMRDWYRDWYE